MALWGSAWISALDTFPLLRVSAVFFHCAVLGQANTGCSTTAYVVVSVFHKKFPNPVFSRLLREVSRRDEIIRKHLNQFKVKLRPINEAAWMVLRSTSEKINQT